MPRSPCWKAVRSTSIPIFPPGASPTYRGTTTASAAGRRAGACPYSPGGPLDLVVDEIPYGTTTSSLIDSILKANEKGKIKIKSIDDNTAEKVEILIRLAPGISPDKTIDALYAFTDCEVSVSPICCVIREDKPAFLGVSDVLRYSTERTLEMLRQELQVQLDELRGQWQAASLEKLFIEQRIYKLFDNLTYEQAIELTREKLKPFEPRLLAPITDEDLQRLLEIRMRRITRHDADEPTAS